ncbi:MAG: DinB family protein [Algibacter sp.]
MKIMTQELLVDLIEKTKVNINKAEGFKKLNEKELNYKETIDTWSILECIEHLNIYGDFYNPEIKACIMKTHTTSTKIFKSGVIGNYFVNLISPKEKLNKMKTLKVNNPLGSNLDKNVIERFISQQKECLELIEKSKNINLTKTKTAISISKLIKMRLGDTFRFITAHNERHILQAENILKKADR